MARGPLTFKQRDITAAIRAAVQAGQQVDRIEIRRDGSFAIILANGKEQVPEPGSASSEWDDLR